MTAEYLDRSSLAARMKYYEEHTTEESGEHYAYSVALREIRNAPAADVAPVVRCRDCIYNIDGLCFCRRPLGSGVAVEPEDFCCWGETE